MLRRIAVLTCVIALGGTMSYVAWGRDEAGETTLPPRGWVLDLNVSQGTASARACSPGLLLPTVVGTSDTGHLSVTEVARPRGNWMLSPLPPTHAKPADDVTVVHRGRTVLGLTAHVLVVSPIGRRYILAIESTTRCVSRFARGAGVGAWGMQTYDGTRTGWHGCATLGFAWGSATNYVLGIIIKTAQRGPLTVAAKRACA
jgi:hypothetical protein